MQNQLKRSTIKYIVLFNLLLISCAKPSFMLYASTITSSSAQPLEIYYRSAQDIKKQLDSIAQTLYSNKVEGKSSNQVIQLLNFASQSIDQLSNSLSTLEKDYTSDLIPSTRFKILASSIDLLKYMTAFLLDYAQQNDTTANFGVLQIYFKLDSALEQILLDYQSLK